MNQLPPDDPRLSAFLRRYRPAPPSSKGNLEEYLFARIEQDVRTYPKNVFLLFSSAIIAGVIMGWGVYRYSSPPEITATAPELENFVLDSWNRGATEVTFFNDRPSWTTECLNLTETNNYSKVALHR